ncbi:MAG TPA: UDP binding domain-containing protein, partial [Gemmatimonadaceae bacterium]|nr:UDP binding domain-containing protein [Gemmatimonadaceae bacterium]
LEEQGASVAYHDPHVPVIREDGHVREGVELTPQRLANADAVVIVTDHRAIDYQMVMNNASLIVDTRNATAKLTKTKARVVSLATVRPVQDTVEA